MPDALLYVDADPSGQGGRTVRIPTPAPAPATAVPVPRRLANRPRVRGFVVPWFVAETEPGVYDFRVMDGRKLVRAVRELRCWICGQELGRYLAFTVGPMCAVNRVSGEPPAHRECAEYSVRVCPFLTQREVRRRPGGLPEAAAAPAGLMIERQPGVALVWITRRYTVIPVQPDQAHGIGGGVLFEMGEPVATLWWREGRPATRAEVEASIDSGYPLLLATAEQEGPEAVADLTRLREAVGPMLPEDG